MTAGPITKAFALVLELASITCFDRCLHSHWTALHGNNMRRAVPVTKAASRLAANPLSLLTTSVCSSPVAYVEQRVESSSSATIQFQVACPASARQVDYSDDRDRISFSAYQTTQNILRSFGLKRKGVSTRPSFPQTTLLKLRHLEPWTEVSYVTLQTASGVAA
jgi:hypothetical protein